MVNNHSVSRPCRLVNTKISLKLLLPRYMYLYHHIFNECVLIEFIILCRLLTTFIVSLFSVLMLLLMHICGQTVSVVSGHQIKILPNNSLYTSLHLIYLAKIIRLTIMSSFIYFSVWCFFPTHPISSIKMLHTVFPLLCCMLHGRQV